ncbi:hypothetical protein [Nocardioides sp.]|uniref:hypothetical protein n=1 Tax=Nocardioides sp. TaxID=35761 RepID=UPI0027274CD6|nr:hypothetical protein [Nocardioides sp.]MDO9454712.1 hypothetical protein [Nocardioides sp.]
MPTIRMHPVPPHGRSDGARAARPVLGLRGRQEWERANRRGLLTVHGLVGTLAGLLILVNGTARAFDDHGASWRPVTGLLAVVGGTLLLVGLNRHRAVRLEVAGLLVLAAWDLAMVAGFVAGAASTGVGVSRPWQTVTDVDSTPLYPVVLYVGLFVMICVHLLTLREIRRSEARRRVTVARAA